ncbi:MAG: HD domain-containing protein [Caldilineaceae bacterium]|nr:HD domain-containing protein [Caldilineaceae bacterium]
MTSNNSRLDQQITFILELEKLKGILRATQPIGLERRENSAEHSWHVALLALLLVEHANQPVDPLRVVKMLLVHDVVEIDAGDTPAYAVVDRVALQARERAAAERLFGLLPEDQAAEFHQLWREFEARETPESKFANALDRFMPLLQNYYANGGTWAEFGANLDRVLQRLRPIDDGSTELWRFAQTLLDDAVARGLILPGQAT